MPRLKTRGIKIGILDKNRNLVAGPFDTYQQTADATGFGMSTITKYKKSGKLCKSCCYIVEIDALDLFNLDHIMPIFDINKLNK